MGVVGDVVAEGGAEAFLGGGDGSRGGWGCEAGEEEAAE